MSLSSKSLQSHQMQSELLRLLNGVTVFVVFSLLGYSLLEESLPFALSIFGIACIVVSAVFAFKLRRARAFYLLFFVLEAVNSAFLFLSSFRMVFVGELRTDISISWSMVTGLGLTILGIWTYFQIIRSKFRGSIEQNLRSGRLDLKYGYWRFDKPLHLDSPEANEKNLAIFERLSKLSPLVTAFGLTLANVIESGLQIVVFGVCIYTFACIVAWGAAKHLAFALQLFDWEYEYGIEIRV